MIKIEKKFNKTQKIESKKIKTIIDPFKGSVQVVRVLLLCSFCTITCKLMPLRDLLRVHVTILFRLHAYMYVSISRQQTFL